MRKLLLDWNRDKQGIQLVIVWWVPLWPIHKRSMTRVQAIDALLNTHRAAKGAVFAVSHECSSILKALSHDVRPSTCAKPAPAFASEHRE